MLSTDLVHRLVKKYDLDLLVLFGSRVGVNARKESDIDIAYLSKCPLSNDQWDEMMCCIMEHTHLNRVDLVDLHKEHGLLIRYQIYTKGKLLFESRQGLFREKKIDAILHYSDARPVLMDFIDRKLNAFLLSKKYA